MTHLPLRTRACLALLLAGLACPAASFASATPAANGAVRILIVGDSTTQGSAGDWTWRYRLWRHFQALGVAVDFVGPRSDLWDRNTETMGNQQYADPAFDRDHAARWGMSLRYQATPIDQLVIDYQPDVVVELLGFNDFYYGASVSDVDARLTDFVSAARSAAPSVKVVLGGVAQTWIAGVPEFDDQLADLAAGLDTADSRVVAAADPGLTEFVDTYDPAHPAATGEVKIAASVADALASLGLGAPMQRPLPVVANGPREPATLTVTPGQDDATLDWALPPGADAVYIEKRDIDSGSPDWQRLPYPISYPQLTWTSGGLTPGHRYQYRVRATKGTAIAEDVVSDVVETVPGVPVAVPGFVVVAQDHGFRASWHTATLATSYRVRWWPAGHADRAVSSTTTDLARSVGRLVAGQEYVVTVRGLADGVAGPVSRRVRVTPTAVPPAAPSGFRVRIRTPGVAVLAWTGVPRATVYEVWRRNVSASGSWRRVLVQAASAATRATIRGLRLGSRYAFKVRARHQLVPGAFTAPVTVRARATGRPATSGPSASGGGAEPRVLDVGDRG